MIAAVATRANGRLRSSDRTSAAARASVGARSPLGPPAGAKRACSRGAEELPHLVDQGVGHLRRPQPRSDVVGTDGPRRQVELGRQVVGEGAGERIVERRRVAARERLAGAIERLLRLAAGARRAGPARVGAHAMAAAVEDDRAGQRQERAGAATPRDVQRRQRAVPTGSSTPGASLMNTMSRPSVSAGRAVEPAGPPTICGPAPAAGARTVSTMGADCGRPIRRASADRTS